MTSYASLTYMPTKLESQTPKVLTIFQNLVVGYLLCTWESKL